MSRFKGGAQQSRVAAVATPAVAVAVRPVAPANPAPRSLPVEANVAMERPGPMSRVALFCALSFVFIRFSFIHEVLGLAAGIKSYLPTIFGTLTIVAVVVAGGIPRALRGRGSLYWVGFGIWLALATVMSSWRGGSYAVINGFFRNDFLLFLAIAGLIVVWKDLLALVYTLCAAGIFNEITMRWLGKIKDNRLEGGVVTIGNANDFAAHILLILPFLWIMATRKQVPAPLRWVARLAVVYGLYLAGSTASRGALLALLVMGSLAVAYSSGPRKILVLGASACTLALLLALLPGSVLSRYQSMVSSDSATTDREAESSSTERLRILEDSLNITIHNPIFGVGPGEFGDRNGFQAIAEGRSKDFSVTHNSYTQISSENGIPALLFFLAGIVSTFTVINGVRKRAILEGNQEVASAARAILISCAGFCVSAFFLSMAYRIYFPVIGGVSIALSHAAGQALRKTPGGIPRRL